VVCAVDPTLPRYGTDFIALFRVVAALGHGYAISGRRGDALKIVRELQERSKKELVPSYNIATIYIGLGMKDEALQYLAKAYDEGSYFMIHLKVEPLLDSVRHDPRFADIVRRVGHVQVK
jgi:tetratricopeptide (TPR) repeat protein